MCRYILEVHIRVGGKEEMICESYRYLGGSLSQSPREQIIRRLSRNAILWSIDSILVSGNLSYYCRHHIPITQRLGKAQTEIHGELSQTQHTGSGRNSS